MWGEHTKEQSDGLKCALRNRVRKKCQSCSLWPQLRPLLIPTICVQTTLAWVILPAMAARANKPVLWSLYLKLDSSCLSFPFKYLMYSINGTAHSVDVCSLLVNDSRCVFQDAGRELESATPHLSAAEGPGRRQDFGGRWGCVFWGILWWRTLPGLSDRARFWRCRLCRSYCLLERRRDQP